MQKERKKKLKNVKNASQKPKKNLKNNVTKNENKDKLYEYIIKSGF